MLEVGDTHLSSDIDVSLEVGVVLTYVEESILLKLIEEALLVAIPHNPLTLTLRVPRTHDKPEEHCDAQ